MFESEVEVVTEVVVRLWLSFDEGLSDRDWPVDWQIIQASWMQDHRPRLT